MFQVNNKNTRTMPLTDFLVPRFVLVSSESFKMKALAFATRTSIAKKMLYIYLLIYFPST